MTNPTNPYGDFDEDGMPRSRGKFADSSGAYSSGMPYSDPYPQQQPNMGQGYQDPSQHNFHNGYSNPYQRVTQTSRRRRIPLASVAQTRTRATEAQVLLSRISPRLQRLCLPSSWVPSVFTTSTWGTTRVVLFN